MYYNRIHLIFLEQNPSVSCFNIYRPSWEYLQDCPRFTSITRALASNPTVQKKRKKEADDVKVEVEEVGSGREKANSSSSDQTSCKEPRPMGTNASKRRAEEERIIENVSGKLKNGFTSTGSAAVASAINDFSIVLSSFFKDWQDRAAFASADAALRKQYDELRLKERIWEMQQQQRAREARETEAQKNHFKPQVQLQEEVDEEVLLLEEELHDQEEELRQQQENEAEEIAAEEELRLQREREAEDERRLQSQIAAEEELWLQREREAEDERRLQAEEELRLQRQKQAEEELRLQKQAEEELRLQKQAEEELRLQRQKESEKEWDAYEKQRKKEGLEKLRDLGRNNFLLRSFGLGPKPYQTGEEEESQVIVFAERYEESLPIHGKFK
jgi:hypothetical protein